MADNPYAQYVKEDNPYAQYAEPNGGASGKWRQWSDVPGEAVGNLRSSAGDFAKGLYQAVRHPVDTASTLLDAAAGGLRNAVPAPVAGLIDKMDPNPAAAARASQTASNVAQVYKDRYGSIEGLKNTLATDPVGAMADLSTVLGGGAALAPKGSMLERGLGAASKYTNPLTPVVAAGRGVADAAGTLAKNTLGLTTGTSGEAISTAYNAGKAKAADFWNNLTGKVPMTDVLQQAQADLLQMKQAKSDAYRSGMVNIKGDKTVLGFGDIDKAVAAAKGMTEYNGKVVNPSAASKVAEMEKIVSEWKNANPQQFHTPEGLDALKQRLGAIVESIPFEERTARKAAGGVYSAVKDSITQQAPKYAEVMKNYSEASDLVREIERTLSQGPNATADTALRKLQSVMRNNANTNYGQRVELVKTLGKQGGNDLMPALAGQSLSSWTPRGLAGLVGGGEAALAASSLLSGNPALAAKVAATAMMSSPRLIGMGAYGLGRLSDLVPGVSDPAMTGALLMQRGGALSQ